MGTRWPLGCDWDWILQAGPSAHSAPTCILTALDLLGHMGGCGHTP